MIGLPPLTNGFFIFMIEYHKIFDLADIVYFCEFDQIIKTEQWCDLTEYEGFYRVSDLGRVKTVSRKVLAKGNSIRNVQERILKPGFNPVGYLVVNISKNGKQRTYQIHQLVAICFKNHKLCGYEKIVNHINFIKIDNRSLNLEIVTARENTNHKHLKSSSQYTGVCWAKNENKWVSKIYIKGNLKHLGYFRNEIDAHNAYQEALKKLI